MNPSHPASPTRTDPFGARSGRTGRGRLRRAAAGAAVALLTGALLCGAMPADAVPASSAPTSTVTGADPFVPVAGPVFGDPTARHNEIITRLLDNIAHTPRGATIQIVGYSFSLGNVATALLDAQARGVNVQVVMDGHSGQWSPAKRLVPALGTDITKPSFFVLTHGSARGTGGVTHQKSWTFSQVGQTPDVVMAGSTNLTGYGTQVQYSDVYVYTDRSDVYGVYSRLFDLQKRDQPITHPFVSSSFDHGSAYFFPKPGTTAATDPALGRIQALPSGPGTTIAVSQFAWYGPRGLWLAHALADKKRAGATIVVVAGESVGAGVKNVLTSVHIPVYRGVYPNGKRIHTKLMLASYDDATGSHTSIWTGSDNWADQSLRNDDDVLQVQDDTAGYNAYVGFFDLLADPSAPATDAPLAPVPLDSAPAAPTPVPAPAPTPVPAPAAHAKRASSLTLHLSRARLHRHGRAVASGRLGADYAGRTVLVQRHRYRHHTWHTVARSARLKASSAYRVLVPTGKTGYWRYRTVVRATPAARATVSRSAWLRVVR